MIHVRREKMLDEQSYTSQVFVFRTRQAGVSVIYDPHLEKYIYNAYCIETELLKELYSQEFQHLEEALDRINDEFGNWELKQLFQKKDSGCGSCVAK